jgi:hypothetical protein
VRPWGTLPILVWLLVCGGTGVASPANAEGPDCHPAELFATDPLEDSQLFEPQADATLALNGVAVTGSTAVDGVFWSTELQQTTDERSREFHLCVADEPSLHTAAEALRSQFGQEVVLTFDYLPRVADAVIISVPDVDIARFRDAFVADSAAHRLLGGSVTTADHTLLLVAGNEDLEIAGRLVVAAGGRWDAATVAQGKRQLVK